MITTTTDATTSTPALMQLGRELAGLGYTFTTVTPATHERVNARPGNEVARDLRDVFGWSRPFDPAVLPTRIVGLLTAADEIEPVGDLWRSRVRFSSYDGELFAHSAFPTDAPDSVFFGPDTYRLAGTALECLAGRTTPVRRAVDIGCGTGAGAIILAKRLPDAEVLAVDMNPAALRFTRINAALAGTANVAPRHSDLLGDVPGRFDLIIANPPFMIDPAGRAYRDGGGPEGNDLSLRIVETAAERLQPGGSLALLSGTGIAGGHDPLRAAVAERLAGTGLEWTYRELDVDAYDEELDGDAYAHAERIAIVALIATRPLTATGGGSPATGGDRQ